VWLDDLSRDRLTTGNLAELISETGIVGVTTNPAIFGKAMSVRDRLRRPGRGELKAAGADVSDAVFAMAVEDVRNACDAFAAVYSGLRRRRRPGLDRGRPPASPTTARARWRRRSSCTRTSGART
jgi:transaldolase